MQYVLLIYGEENGWASRSEDELKALYAEYGKLSGELRAQGKLLAGGRATAGRDRDHRAGQEGRDHRERRTVRRPRRRCSAATT